MSNNSESLISFAKARETVLLLAQELPYEKVGIFEAPGRINYEEIKATFDLPSFRNSSMDGYAIHSADTATPPYQLEVVAHIAAGDSVENLVVPPGCAARIFTGAMIPPDIDAVINQEAVEQIKIDDKTFISVAQKVDAGRFIREPGSDMERGETIVQNKECLSPSHIGLVASFGISQIKVFKKPTVGIFSTGSELQTTNEGTGSNDVALLGRGKIFDSNRPALFARVLLASCNPKSLTRVNDSADDIRRAIELNLDDHDVLLLTGGVSVGDHDHVKNVINELAAKYDGICHVMRIAMRPGKPFVCARIKNTVVFGLAGNPVSALVGFELLVAPLLAKISGQEPVEFINAITGEDFLRKPDSEGRIQFDRVELKFSDEGQLKAFRLDKQQSHQLSGMSKASGLALIPNGFGIDEGYQVKVLPIGNFWGQ
ncbi:MAG: molybdopterin molybdotransferase MoeA [Acidimicrobiales bacterium]|nr:molybdopterin molybdotransferase MoeA [Acidimicrobiales bacterium]